MGMHGKSPIEKRRDKILSRSLYSDSGSDFPEEKSVTCCWSFCYDEIPESRRVVFSQ